MRLAGIVRLDHSITGQRENLSGDENPVARRPMKKGQL
jgi:hypothetical protein